MVMWKDDQNARHLTWILKISIWGWILKNTFLVDSREFQATANLEFTSTVENMHTIAILGKHDNLILRLFYTWRQKSLHLHKRILV